MRGARPQTCCTRMPLPIATSLADPSTEPCASAAVAVGDAPPSNWTILASMQRLANSPSSLATNGVVWTTLGGADDTPTLILRMVGQVCALASCVRASAIAMTAIKAEESSSNAECHATFPHSNSYVLSQSSCAAAVQGAT